MLLCISIKKFADVKKKVVLCPPLNCPYVNAVATHVLIWSNLLRVLANSFYNQRTLINDQGFNPRIEKFTRRKVSGEASDGAVSVATAKV